jgi:shikimate kinase
MDLQDYIDRFGDEDFIRFEEKTILKLNVQNCVIAPGGSIIYSQKAINHLKRNSIIVFLDLSLEVLKSRTKDVDKRGIVYLKRKSYEEVFYERLPLYIKYADITIKTDNLTIAQVIHRISQKLRS